MRECEEYQYELYMKDLDAIVSIKQELCNMVARIRTIIKKNCLGIRDDEIVQLAIFMQEPLNEVLYDRWQELLENSQTTEYDKIPCALTMTPKV